MSPLRKKMLDDMTIRGLSDSTKNIYINAVTGLVQHYGCRPDTIEAQQVQDYLLFLHEERGLSWSTCNTCLYGIPVFLPDHTATAGAALLRARGQATFKAARNPQPRTTGAIVCCGYQPQASSHP